MNNVSILKVVEKVVEKVVPKYIHIPKPYPVIKHVHIPVEVKVPVPVEKKVKVYVPQPIEVEKKVRILLKLSQLLKFIYYFKGPISGENLCTSTISCREENSCPS